MSKLIIIMCLMLVLITVCLYGVDFIYYLKNRYCRFHIGRWNTEDEWEKAIYKVTLKWSKKTPTVKITDNSRYILLDIIGGRYRSRTIQSWQNASIILGLMDRDISASRTSANKYIDKNGQWNQKPVAVDSSMLAYAILKVIEDKDYCKPAMDFMMGIIINNTDKDNLISYTGGADNSTRYVDTLGLVCPFICLYAKKYNKPEYYDLAFRQLQYYHDKGIYEETCLPNHAIDKDSELPLGVYGWGRGVAWYILGLLYTYEELPEGNSKEQIKQWLEECAVKYIIYQHEDGGFGSIFQRKNTYDSSATATMAEFYFACSIIFENRDYLDVSNKCLIKLRKATRINGKIDWCQGDTKDIGVFAQTYDIMPFAQGMTMKALNRKMELLHESKN